jgi:hypothetical protein
LLLQATLFGSAAICLVLALRERSHHVLGGQRRATVGLGFPENRHHHGFGFADLHRLHP